MCAICGCEGGNEPHVHANGHHHDHDHSHGHPHDHAHGHSHDSGEGERSETKTVQLEHALLQKNALLAERNRGFFLGRGVLALNFVSSPGSGKTALLERTISESGLREKLLVIQGDQATDRDAERIRRAGARAVQINTGTGCHLDAAMVARAAAELEPPQGSILAIENVGNLVCPALFDLGEQARIAILSITEGADKPLKYPYLFRGSHVVLLNKMDLLPHVDFDVDECLDSLRQVNPDAEVFLVSAKRGDGLPEWYAWLFRHCAAGIARVACP